MQQFETAATPCNPSITYQVRKRGRAGYVAYCACGWFADTRSNKRRALRDARQHSPNVDGHIHGLEDKRLPAALRAVDDVSTGEVFLH